MTGILEDEFDMENSQIECGNRAMWIQKEKLAVLSGFCPGRLTRLFVMDL